LFRDAVACLGVMIVVLALVMQNFASIESGEPVAEHLGAHLGAPANPAESYAAARPESYFLFLFQALKYLEAFPPVFGAVIVPGLVLLSLFLMPFIGRWDLGHRFNVVWTMALLLGASILTAIAWYDDHSGKTLESQHYLAAVADAERQADRAVELAGSPSGIPPGGALELLRTDSRKHGPRLFREHCAICHGHFDPADPDSKSPHSIVIEKPTAPNLWGFGTREWISGILDPALIASPRYFGNTAHKEGQMVGFVNDTIAAELETLQGDELAAYRRKLEDAALALEAEAGIGTESGNADRIAAGREAIVNELTCTECHKFQQSGELGLAPDLTGYASPEWLTAFIANPAHQRFYPETNDRMPAFAPDPQKPAANRLSSDELKMLVEWLRREWYEPDASRDENSP
jgi:ubiquinol-cytochrome c reductase cytochrome b subunit